MSNKNDQPLLKVILTGKESWQKPSLLKNLREWFEKVVILQNVKTISVGKSKVCHDNEILKLALSRLQIPGKK